MDWLSFILAGLFTYLAVSVFLLGTIYRLCKWWKVSPARMELGYFPKPKKGLSRFWQVLRDSFLYPQAREVAPGIWSFAIIFHFALFAIFIGHLRLLAEFTPLMKILGEEGMHRFSFLSGGTAGIILLVCLVYFLVRRFKLPYKEISVPEDYLLLLLLLLITIMGLHLRFIADIPVENYRAYLHSLFRFKPEFTPTLAVFKRSFVLHKFFVNLLLIYFPFSKLFHFVGTFFLNKVRNE